MNSLKRIFFTLRARLDDVADDLENHEAIAGIAIEELEAYLSKTRIHAHRLREMVEQFERQLVELHKEADTWSARAIKSKSHDEAKALECVKRMLQVRKQIATIEPELAKIRVQQAQCLQDSADIQTQLQTLHTQKEVLSARQNRVHLHSSLRTESVNPTIGAQAVFKRWEQSVVGGELSGPVHSLKDSFADEFLKEESELELQRMLDDLIDKAQDA